MKKFDTLFHGKSSWADSRSGNSARVEKKVDDKYHDIHPKRSKVVPLKKPTKNLSHYEKVMTFPEVIARLQETVKKWWSQRRLEHVILLMFLVFVSFVIYGIGFALRTEKTLTEMRENPSLLTDSYEARKTLFHLWQDYQILWLVADNSPWPIEPLTSYGRILRGFRDIVGKSGDMQDFFIHLQTWYTGGMKTSYKPLWNEAISELDHIASWLAHVSDGLTQFLPTDDRSVMTQEVSKLVHNFLKHKKIWKNLFLRKTLSTRILVLNQNSDEIRAGGGFPGTTFLIEMQDGYVKQAKLYDIYELDWHLTGYRPSPEGINQFKSLDYPGRPVEFEIRDANYFPTFAESARVISELMNTAGYGEIDLLVGVNTQMFTDILREIWPIQIDGISTPITADNATTILSLLVEAKIDRDGSHKNIIAEVGNAISEKDFSQALPVILEDILGGQVMLGSPQADIQKAIDELGIIDEWKSDTGDFVYPLFTSVSRNKSDRYMDRNISVEHTDVCTRVLDVQQTHTWNVEKEIQVKQLAWQLGITLDNTWLFVQGKGDNRQYVRFIFPPKTEIISTSKSFVVHELQDMTLVDGYVITPIGGDSNITIRYQIDSSRCEDETTVYHQPGIRMQEITR